MSRILQNFVDGLLVKAAGKDWTNLVVFLAKNEIFPANPRAWKDRALVTAAGNGSLNTVKMLVKNMQEGLRIRKARLLTHESVEVLMELHREKTAGRFRAALRAAEGSAARYAAKLSISGLSAAADENKYAEVQKLLEKTLEVGGFNKKTKRLGIKHRVQRFRTPKNEM